MEGTVREPSGKVKTAVGSRYQVTGSEDCNTLRRPSVSYSDLLNVYNSENINLTCSSELRRSQ
jgi:hypothetical protein